MTVSVLAFIPSPAQGVWHLGPVPVRAYALCIIVGIVAALIIGDRRWVARGGEPGVIYDIALWAVPFGLIGGRLYHVITDWQTYFGKDGAGLGAALRIWDGGLGIWGAVALGGVGAWIGCRQRGIPLPAFGDAIAPGIVLAQAIGRLGNYFNQELYGRPTTLPWGLEIYERRDNAGALDSLNGVSTGQLVDVVHPTFLYELLWNLLVFAVLIWVDRRFKIGHGRLFALYVAGYCVGRFWVELMRSDVATHIAGIRINTFTSTFVFVAAVVYIMVAPKGREDPATLKGKDVDAEESVLDELGEELTAVAATSGVVAAAKVAGEDYERDAEPSSAEAFAADIESEAVESEALEESEAGAEAKDLVEQVETAPSENIAEAEAFAAASAAADAAESDAAESDTAEPEEVVEAEGVASEVHEAAAVGADEAEALAEDVGAESETVEAEPESEAAQPESEAEPEEGLGSVEGNEVVEAEAVSSEVHEAAAVGADEAEALAEEVGAESETVEAEPESEAAQPESEAEPEEGLGSVEGDEVVEAEAVASEVHEAAAVGADEAEGVEAEPERESEADDVEPESTAEPEEGLGSVEGDEVVEAEAVASEVHEAAAVGADEAEALAEEVEAEPESEADDVEPESTAEPEEGLGSVEGDEVAAAEEDAPEVHDAAAQAEDVAAEPPRRRWWRRRG